MVLSLFYSSNLSGRDFQRQGVREKKKGKFWSIFFTENYTQLWVWNLYSQREHLGTYMRSYISIPENCIPKQIYRRNEVKDYNTGLEIFSQFML